MHKMNILSIINSIIETNILKIENFDVASTWLPDTKVYIEQFLNFEVIEKF